MAVIAPAHQQEKVEIPILRAAAEYSGEALVACNRHRRILFFNPAAERVFGCSRQEALGRDFASLLDLDHQALPLQALLRSLETGEPSRSRQEIELIGLRQNGEVFPAAVSFIPLETEEPPSFLAVIRDLTEIRLLQRQLHQAERLATLGRTVAEISHEIKNPLLLIGGWSHQLLKTCSQEPVCRKLRQIVGEVERLEHLLTDLRGLYAPRAPVSSRIETNQLLEEMKRLLQNDCAARRIRLQLQLGGTIHHILGDREKLLQVLLNLAKNGMEAMPEGGELVIGTRASNRQVEIFVADQGDGIPEHIRRHLFTPFLTTKKGGSGLGLCISKRIIDDHPGSSLEIVSEEGRGTIARLLFPELPTAESATPEAAAGN